jgi:hypothetical protein
MEFCYFFGCSYAGGHPEEVCFCHHRFFSHLDYSYANPSNYFYLHNLSSKRRYLDVLYFKRTFSVVQSISYLFGNCWPKRTR